MLSKRQTLGIGPDGRHGAGDMAQLAFTLNGRAVSVAVEPGMSVLDVLRDELGLRGPKDGCAPEGSCGACTVLA